MEAILCYLCVDRTLSYWIGISTEYLVALDQLGISTKKWLVVVYVQALKLDKGTKGF